MRYKSLCCAAALLVIGISGQQATAQSLGIELHNSLMPASGGMAGTSFSRPQDLQSAINGNPATLGQFNGPIFNFGGALVVPNVTMNQTSDLPLLGVSSFNARSSAPDSLLGNIGVINQTELMGIPVSYGMAFVANAGLSVDYRGVPESDGTHATIIALDTVTSAAVDVSPNLSVGGSFSIGTHILDGPFNDSSSAQTEYATRFVLGANYDCGNGLSVGGFWQSMKDMTFDNVVRFAVGPLAGQFQDLDLQLPQNVGLGIAKRGMMDGRLLLAADVIYKNWSDTDLFGAIYDDQWAVQFGAQYCCSSKLILRAGYGFNEDATRDTVPGTIGGVVPVGGIPAVQYVQGQFAALAQHRLTGGIGVRNLCPNVDLDLNFGGAFEETKSFGATEATVSSYHIAFGVTYRCPVGCTH